MALFPMRHSAQPSRILPSGLFIAPPSSCMGAGMGMGFGVYGRQGLFLLFFSFLFLSFLFSFFSFFFLFFFLVFFFLFSAAAKAQGVWRVKLVATRRRFMRPRSPPPRPLSGHRSGDKSHTDLGLLARSLVFALSRASVLTAALANSLAFACLSWLASPSNASCQSDAGLVPAASQPPVSKAFRACGYGRTVHSFVQPSIRRFGGPGWRRQWTVGPK